MIKYYITLCIFLLIASGALAQAVYEDERYVPETDPLVLEKLEQWQGIKFGLLMHWGTYSQWGIVESWSLCPEDYGWCQRKMGQNPQNYNDYKQEYEGLQKSFNPERFDPSKWAKAAKKAGMRYVVFTTKHHDGFCMFDSKYTDYKITSKACPFNTNANANIAKAIFDAFRAEGMWAGAYFSKPDWHCDSYWDPYFPPLDRNVNYDPEAYPEKWEEYVQFTHNQIEELMSDYGKMDILWLDGGWVAKVSEEEIQEFYAKQGQQTKSGFVKSRLVNQDIRMDELVEKVREKQPGLIVVDRAVHGKNQNYLTPENRVPEKTLPYPWESCLIAGGGWSFNPNAKFMSGNKGVHTLVDIVAKGGNLLLNIAPGPDGTWQDGAYRLLNDYADWMSVNSEAIYDTKPIEPFKENNICLTQKNDGSVYFIYLAKEDEKMPEQIKVESIALSNGTKLNMLGTSKRLKWKKADTGFVVSIPEEIRNNPPCEHAWVIKANKISR